MRFAGKRTFVTLGVLLGLSLIVLFLCKDFIYINPLKEFPYDGVVYAAKDEEGNTFVLDKAGTRLLKVSPENRLVWQLNSSSGMFEGIQRMVLSGGHIFIHDVQTEEGIRLSGESVLELDPNGKLINTVSKYLYSEQTLQPHIIGLFPYGEDEIAFLYKVDDAFRLIKPGVAESNYPYKDAGLFLRSGAFDPNNEAVYFSTYDGKIIRYIEGSENKELYNCSNTEGISIPSELSFSDGNLYAVDIGRRNCIVIDTLTEETDIIEEDIEFFDREIAYNLNANNGLVCVTDYSVKTYAGDNTFDYSVSCSLSSGILLKAVISKAALGIASLLFLILLLLVIVYILKKGNIYARGILYIAAGAAMLSGLIVAVLIPRFQEELTGAFYDRAELVSDVTVSQLPKDSFVRLNSADDFMNEDYQAVRNVVRGIFLSDSDSMKDIYCVLYRVVDGMYSMTYSLKDSVGAIYPYDWDLKDSNEEMVLTTKEGIKYMSSTSEGEYLFTYNPIINEEGEAVGIIEVGKDMESYRSEINKMIIDAFINTIAVTVVMILAIIEVVFFLKGRNEYRDMIAAAGESEIKELPSEIMRTVSFLVFFLTNLPTAFLPIYAMELSNKLEIGIAPEVMSAVPLAAEVITGAIFSILGVRIVEHLGEKKTVILSSILFIAGFAIRIIPGIWMLILGNAVIGIGWGIILMVATLRITELPDEKKDIGFSEYNAASINGVNCGVVLGGFFVNWLNYRSVFIISTLLSVSMLFIMMKYFTGKMKEMPAEQEEKKGPKQVLLFMLNPSVLSLLLMIVAPIMICSYFLNYLYPIIGSEYGLSDTYIGYSYLLNGLCVITLGGVLTNFFTRTKKKQEGLLIASLLYAFAFFIVIRFDNISGLFVALAVLGISDSFGLPLQSGYLTDLPAVQKFGYGNAFGIYNLVINIAQSVGPFIFSYVLIAGMNRGLSIVLLTLTGLALAFIVISKIADHGKRST